MGIEFQLQPSASNAGLPSGLRPADIERGDSALDDLSPPELWRLLDQSRQAGLYREFFRLEWAELSACLDDHELSTKNTRRSADLGHAIRALWLGWRNTAVARLAMERQITSHTQGRKPC